MRKKYLPAEMQRYPFDSARKRMSTILEIPLDEKTENNHPRRIHTKGASEIVLQTCTTYLD
jgi:magnesium-transporting ATPase (P-type)